MREFFEHVEIVRRTHSPAVLATVVAIEGGSSSRLGSRMFVTSDGRRLGSLTSGGCVDSRIVEEAPDVFADGDSRIVSVILGEDEPDFGMSCAGTVHVFVERLRSSHFLAFDRLRALLEDNRQAVLATPTDGRPPFVVAGEDVSSEIGFTVDTLREDDCVLVSEAGIFLHSFAPPRLLVVVGTGPVAEPLVTMAGHLGYRTCVVDGREIVGFETADDRRVGIPSEIMKDLPLDERTAVVITAHDYRHEVPVLREVLDRSVGFVGFLASARRGGAVLSFLETTGTTPERLATVRVPVGLDIGAVTPQEIALSILGEMLAVRNQRPGGSLRFRMSKQEVEGTLP